MHRILGVDPGFARIGIGIIEYNLYDDKLEKNLIYADVIETDKDLEWAKRIIKINNDFKDLLLEFKPNEIYIERQFFNKNVNNAMRVAEARGVMLLEAYKQNIDICEFTPLQMKKRICNNGKASKKDILNSITQILDLKKEIKSDDACDAIGFALMKNF